MSSSPRNENDDVEQGLAASPPSTQNAASRRFTIAPTQNNLPPANATTARTTLWAGISPMDAAAAAYATMAPSPAATMPAAAPSAGSELTRAWTGSSDDNAATQLARKEAPPSNWRSSPERHAIGDAAGGGGGEGRAMYWRVPSEHDAASEISLATQSSRRCAIRLLGHRHYRPRGRCSV
mmetsp:Transcript_37947/g.69695  ORF Transcript_37947/g.69695 Transcript_37947/m.69695 type:complete len:180 (+) Transcript_37947:85-624(+)|eukprot:CAMPEP_0201874070 /NCGR_PEP_ID=MMETSP0902-20130614/6425_1 /ASSEMBLY_ACC=CAM_ASM_000551 /TAXON_ID=420261 /ORGANISM="Thalassiosira antarctica, Strain CCMP982" /LENGTH=179 /DNA_ID=CAMNT_0048400857 /DNA_START=46 /DNA_END=585 /DNA_ORIENTATION=+